MTTIITADDHARNIAAQISAWNTQDVSDLLALIEQLDSHCRRHDLNADHYVDMTSLPSVDIPDDVNTGYPVWAIDVSGNMLVGAAIDEIMSLEDYRAERDA